MRKQDFDRVIGELIADTVSAAGFATSASRRNGTFYRKASDEIYHIIVADPGSRVAWYDVRVFPTSPLIDPLFEKNFPDHLGSDWGCYLSEQGIGPGQQCFNCKNEDNLRNRFAKTVRPLLLHTALPYLDRISTIRDMLPSICNPLIKGFALHYVGRTAEARQLLLAEKESFSPLSEHDKDVAIIVRRIDEALRNA